MSVWAEEPRDGGSAVWGCSTCDRGGWCWDHTTALMEARMHANNHGAKGTQTVRTLGAPQRGPRPDYERDQRIRDLRASSLTLREIAEMLGLSRSGVLKAIRRMEQAS